MKCRFCGNELNHEFINLGNAPPSNSFLGEDQLNLPEIYYPLRLFVCERCYLVQIDEYKDAESIFNDEYIYFSSFSKSWVEHARKYAEMMIAKYGINKDSLVVEIASNDGYLLQHFCAKRIPVLGIEPTSNTAAVAQQKGIECISEFFGARLAKKLAQEGKKADLLIGNNVLAHVPDINDFVSGLKIALKDNGIITMEFPHLMQLIKNVQFDTIYHEHFSYLSFTTVQEIFAKHKLALFDVEELDTHGGSLRIFAKHEEDDSKSIAENVARMLDKEKIMRRLKYYEGFQEEAERVKNDFLEFLLAETKKGKRIVAYGAAAKGNTLLNYCGLKDDMIEFVVDKSVYKQGKYLPGSHIPVVDEKMIKDKRPEYIVILPWNLKDEIAKQLEYAREWGGKFVIAIPGLQII